MIYFYKLHILLKVREMKYAGWDGEHDWMTWKEEFLSGI